MEGPIGDAFGSSSPQHESVLQWSASMMSADRLALRAGDTLLTIARLKRPPAKRDFGFPPSIGSERMQTISSYHPTTSAQCLTALQGLHRNIGALRGPTLPSSHMPMGLRDRSLRPEEVRSLLRHAITEQLQVLRTADTVKAALARLSSAEFGGLNPLTCAHVLRALTPTASFVERTWWWAFFSVFQALSRHSPSPDSTLGASVQDWHPTAVVSAICVDAVTSALALLHRRWLRLRRLVDLIKSLREVDDAEEALSPGTDGLVEGFNDRRQLINVRILFALEEFELDTALPAAWIAWKQAIQDELRRGTAKADYLAGRFGAAVADPAVLGELTDVIAEMKRMIGELDVSAVRPINTLARLLRRAMRSEQRPPAARLDRIFAALRRIGLNDPPYAGTGWSTSLRAALHALGWSDGRGRPFDPPVPLPTLERYWRDHAEAATRALEVTRRLVGYLTAVLQVYVDSRAVGDAAALIEKFEQAAGGLDFLGRDINEAIWPTARWAESVMTRHMAYFHSGRWTSFDVAELAYAAYAIVRSGPPYDANTILSALDIVAKTQRSDGTWSAQQPVIWRQSGLGAYTHTAQVAAAAASTMMTLMGGDEVFASRPTGLLSRLTQVEASLGRTLDWLAGTQQVFPWPDVLEGELAAGDRSTAAVGWCSDRGFETDRIDLSVTANVIEFLLTYREYCQARINITLTDVFSAYAPADLTGLMEVKPTDLDKPFEARLIPQLVAIISGHSRRRLAALSWRFDAVVESDVTCSMIFAGPPGTSKTTLAKALAHELDWPLIVLSPSDFLRRGEENVEGRAREIFQYLGLGSRVLYLFDEVDELLLAREYQQREPLRSVFSFLTPSFLTKLQDLHDAAKRSSIVFVIGTNYLERIDPAAKRRGRIDRTFEVLYPDRKARMAIGVEQIAKKFAEAHPEGERDGGRGALIQEFVPAVADATELFSYNGLLGVCSWLVNEPNAERRRQRLQQIAAGVDPRLKPEIDLSLYSGRPGAVEEFLNILTLCSTRMGDAQTHREAVRAFWGSIPAREQPFWLKKVQAALEAAARDRRILLEDPGIAEILGPGSDARR